MLKNPFFLREVGMDWRERTIQHMFDGDEQRFEKAYDEAVKESIQEAVSWKDIALCATVLPELDNIVQNLIRERLGYLPHFSVRLRYEPYLRALVQQNHQGQMITDNFAVATDAHIKLIRNSDMALYSDLEPAIRFQSAYNNWFHLHGMKAKARLSRILGYEPKPEHSLMAELWLWEVMARDNICLSDGLTPIDYKALTIIKYREILLSEGQAAADASPLFAFGRSNQ